MTDPDLVAARSRARPLAPDDRRSAILDAVIPLLRERGRDVSTRQMAEAAGVAEGTLFRAFGDKESIVAAAMARVTDPGPFRERIRGIDPDAPTEQKVHALVGAFVERFTGVVGVLTALQVQPGPPPTAADFRRSTWFDVVERLFRPEELAVPPATLAFYVRLVAFGSVLPGDHPLSVDDITRLIMRGVLPAPSPTKG